MTPVANVKTFKIDGRDFSARADETILDVARQNNIFIPRLCELEGLSTVTIAASCVQGACECATRLRERTPGM
jgi:bidirectional [NiFe] hydrogenase diaphorase subunit